MPGVSSGSGVLATACGMCGRGVSGNTGATRGPSAAVDGHRRPTADQAADLRIYAPANTCRRRSFLVFPLSGGGCAGSNPAGGTSRSRRSAARLSSSPVALTPPISGRVHNGYTTAARAASIASATWSRPDRDACTGGLRKLFGVCRRPFRATWADLVGVTASDMSAQLVRVVRAAVLFRSP